MSIVPLTVNFLEPALLTQLNQENAFTQQHGPWFQLNNDEKKQAKHPFGPTNGQLLDRYTYCLNSPLMHIDPTGHTSGGNEFFGWEEEDGYLTIWKFGNVMAFKLNDVNQATFSMLQDIKDQANAFDAAIGSAALNIFRGLVESGVCGLAILEMIVTAPDKATPFYGQAKLAIEFGLAIGTAIMAISDGIQAIADIRTVINSWNNGASLWSDLSKPNLAGRFYP